MSSNTRIKLSDVNAQMKRREAKSRVIFRTSGENPRTTDTTESIISDWTSSHVSRSRVFSKDSVSESHEAVRPWLTQVHGGLDTQEKLTQECDYFSLKPVDSHRELFADIDDVISSCSQSLADRDRRQSLSISQTPSKIVQTCTDWSDDLQPTKDDDSLPPYGKIVQQMFYRFCGISRGSNCRQLQSRDDFEQLLKCLGMEEFVEDFLIWFPKPEGMISNRGYISLKMFAGLFSGKFAQTVLEKRREYEILCSAIMTMNCLDKKKLNRIEFQQFLRLYRGLYDIEISVGNVSSVFNKYDIDGSGILTIVNIFNFCCDEDLSLE